MADEDVQEIGEGKARVLLPKSVFYNPVQEFNRDLTVSILSQFAEEHVAEQLAKARHKSKRAGEKVQPQGSEGGHESATEQKDAGDGAEKESQETILTAGVKCNEGLRIFEGLAASGLRSIRFGLEVPGVKEVIANDFDKNAVGFIERNIAKNDLTGLVNSSYGDASMVMYQNKDFASSVDFYVRVFVRVYTGQKHVKMAVTKTSMVERMIGMLSVAREELQHVPLYYILDDLCNVLHCSPPNMVQMRSALLHAGYKVSLSHAAKNSYKTDAPAKVIWDVMRCWVKDHPVSAKRLVEGSVALGILQQPPALQASFLPHPDANPTSRQKGLVRWQQNPEPDWGPKPRARRKEGKDAKGQNAKTQTEKGQLGKRNCEEVDFAVSCDQ
nr:hypothetical protein BaRGS_033766 [Batillaria attramentaria]